MAGGLFCWKPGAEEENDKLDALRSKAYELAEYIKRHKEVGKA